MRCSGTPAGRLEHRVLGYWRDPPPVASCQYSKGYDILAQPLAAAATGSHMEHVRYIEKTRDYYRRGGYAEEYTWARFDDGPLARLRVPLEQCRAMIVSTASLVTLDEQGSPTEPARLLGTNELEVFPLPSDLPVTRLRSASEDHDRFQTDMSDTDAYFPISRIRELVGEGILASVADRHLRILPNYSQRKVSEIDAPEVLRRCRADAVDVVLLTPI